ncbi:hypothetical protein PTKIN_Ptkin17bG0149800 [Pterospermum kingtungense]
MEQNQEKKFVCKFCNKTYPCGKSLGGHIRTHMSNVNCTEPEELGAAAELSMNQLCNNVRNIKRVAEAEAGGGGQSAAAGYGLRENPKKTKRFADSGNGCLLKEMICKECGKGFQSLKALCGHMACHSEKERVFQKFEDDNHSGNSEKQKVIMDSQSDTETSAPSRRRRSKRIRYKAIGVYSNNNSASFANGSSSVSEIEQEQEEVAMCLMMLSRDSGCKKGLDSLADSSDNNSVVLEAKSPSIDVRITIKNDMKCGGELLNVKKPRDIKLKSAESGASSENSDSGYFRNGPKKVESDGSVDGFLKSAELKKKLKVVESGSGFEDFDAKFGKNLSKFKCVKTEFAKDMVSEVGDNRADRTLTKYDLRRIAKNDYYSADILFNTSPKGNKYECLTCNKTFDSHRALGGHRASHTKVNEYCSESIQKTGTEDRLADDSFSVPMTDHSKATKSSHGKSLSSTPRGSSGNAEKRLGSKKIKGHECPFCFRVFKSGQALGGHKRSHFVGGSENRTLVIKQDSPDQMPALIDLNLPAPVEEDAMVNAGFMPW